MVTRIDLNCDMGESFGRYKLGLDEEIVKYITSGNVACGFHAGDPIVMRQTVKLLANHHVKIGAHPGLSDLMGFGRRNMAVTPHEIKCYLLYQIGAIQAFTKAEHKKLQHVKPHGALYNMASESREMADAIAETVAEVDDKRLILVGLANSKMIEAGENANIRVAREAFADRAYNSNGQLVSRKREGSVISNPDSVAERAIRIVSNGNAKTIDDTLIELGMIDTICIHGDTPGVIDIARNLRIRLKEAGIRLMAMGTL